MLERKWIAYITDALGAKRGKGGILREATWLQH